MLKLGRNFFGVKLGSSDTLLILLESLVPLNYFYFGFGPFSQDG